MYKLVRKIETGKNGGETLFFADVNNDGVKEIIIRQSGGFYDSKFYRDDLVKFTKFYNSESLTEENSMLLQLTCMTQEGEILWQKGRPWPDERPYISHASLGMTASKDINNDGRTEILYLLKDCLYMLDGETGELISSTVLPTEAINLIYFQKMGDCYHILLKCDGESEFGYGKPLLAYDTDLNLLWQHTQLSGAGHSIVLSDVDGDGNDEIFEGYNLLDHDGSIIWSHDFPSHADQIIVEDINSDNIKEVIYCTDGLDFIVLNTTGKILYSRQDFVHPQKVSLGRFMPEKPGMQMFMNNKACDGGSFMLDCNGKELWEFPCNGYAQTIKRKDGDWILFCPSPGRLPQEVQDELSLRALKLGYENLPLEKESSADPFVLNGQGEIIYRFENLENDLDVEKWDLPRFIQNYFGGFDMVVHDIDCDGEDEIVIFNRQNIWIYK